MMFDKDFESYIRGVLDRGHTARPEAAAPPSETWHRVLARIQPKPEEKNEMSTIAFAETAATARTIETPVKNGLGHYINLAATIALVLAVAVAGWFATMQLNQPGSDNGRFAFLDSTPVADQSAVCDVDPLTVDDVMAIVRNPYRYMFDRADPDSQALVSYQLAADQELMVGNIIPSWHEFNSVNRATPDSPEFEEASEAVNTYIACLQDATWGHYWALYHPVWVQQNVLAQFPVFADEESVKAHIENVIDEPVDASFNTLDGFYSAYGEVEITANPDPEKADLILYSSADYEPTIAMGIVATHDSGDVIMETGSTGYPHQIQPGAILERPVIVVQKSSVTGVWYVMPLGSR